MTVGCRDEKGEKEIMSGQKFMIVQKTCWPQISTSLGDLCNPKGLWVTCAIMAAFQNCNPGVNITPCGGPLPRPVLQSRKKVIEGSPPSLSRQPHSFSIVMNNFY